MYDQIFNIFKTIEKNLQLITSKYFFFLQTKFLINLGKSVMFLNSANTLRKIYKQNIPVDPILRCNFMEVNILSQKIDKIE